MIYDIIYNKIRYDIYPQPKRAGLNRCSFHKMFTYVLCRSDYSVIPQAFFPTYSTSLCRIKRDRSTKNGKNGDTQMCRIAIRDAHHTPNSPM